MKTHLIVAAVSAVIAGGMVWQAQSWRYEKQIASMQNAHAVAMQEAESQARMKEAEMRDYVERIANETERKQSEFVSRAVDAERAAGGLRIQIARLNARSAPSDPAAAAAAHEATVARELLGSCSEEYRAVATEADRLRIQVTGLHEYVNGVVKTKPLSH